MDDGSVDYQAYLAGLYPGTTWSLARLAGGLVNRTLRATLVAGSAPHRSLIVKHARPYVETAGPEWAFSTDRQVSTLCITPCPPCCVVAPSRRDPPTPISLPPP